MDTALEIELLNKNKVRMKDLTIGQALDIAKIPYSLNENRLTAMISHISGDLSLAKTMTVQERYYFLINYQSIADDHYSGGNDTNGFIIDTVQKDVPNEAIVGDLVVTHLYGAHADILDKICEGVADWIMGKMACQLSGDLRSIVGGDNDELIWDSLPISIDSAEAENTILDRVALLNELTVDHFNMLSDAFESGNMQLQHFVITSCDNFGITVLPTAFFDSQNDDEGGEDKHLPARFRALNRLRGTAAQLARFITNGRVRHDGTRQDEPTGSA